MRRLSILKHLCIPAMLCVLFCVRPALADPVCEISRMDQGPPFKVTFSVQERTIGIKTITVVEAINASVSFEPFPPGYINAIAVVATKVDQGGDFSVTVQATDMSNLVSSCGYEQEAPVEERPPTCAVTFVDPGPPFYVDFTIQDEDGGLEIISVLESLNADVTIPFFLSGTTDPVTVRATKQNEALSLLVTLEALDTDGRSTICRYEQDSADKEPPIFEIVSQNPGPPYSLQVGVQDTDSGLGSITSRSATNATVFIPDFAQGTRDVVVIGILQTIGNLDFSVLLEARDMNDNASIYEYPVQSFREARPEFDAVGNDSDMLFKDYCKDMIIVKGLDRFGRAVNNFSDFSSEGFTNTAAGLTPDPCFSSTGNVYLSALAGAWTQAEFQWKIVLQMKPASDMSLHIVGCVLSAGESDVWKHARQTGLYSAPWAPRTPIFVPQANPRIRIRALPGPFAMTGFPQEGFYLDARKAPGLETSPLLAGALTLQSMVEGTIILALPKTGYTSALGQTMYEMNRGDVLEIIIETPYNNTADVRFGRDNVFLKYLGLVGTEYTTLD